MSAPSKPCWRLWVQGAAIAAMVHGSAESHADALTAQQIVDRAVEHNVLGLDNAVARLSLKLVSKRGTERVRQVEVMSIQPQGLARTLVRFHAPADVAGTAFLVHEHKDRDDDQYLYLPALGKVKRITGGQRNQRFMGTDLTYADLESRALRRSTLQRMADTQIGGNPVYVIEAVPKDLTDSQYKRTRTWVHKTSFVPLKIEFYDKQDQLLKVLTVRRLEKKQGRWVAMDSLVKNVQRNSRTELVVLDISFQVPLTEADFSQTALGSG